MQAFRAAILRFSDSGEAIYDADGLLVIGPDANGRQAIRAVGPYATLAANYRPGFWIALVALVVAAAPLYARSLTRRRALLAPPEGSVATADAAPPVTADGVEA